jgi:hypothetical protein
MKCTKSTQTKEGSKWLKKHKIRNKVRENNLLEEKIKEASKTYRGQVSKRKKTLMGASEHLVEKKEE